MPLPTTSLLLLLLVALLPWLLLLGLVATDVVAVVLPAATAIVACVLPAATALAACVLSVTMEFVALVLLAAMVIVACVLSAATAAMHMGAGFLLAARDMATGGMLAGVLSACDWRACLEMSLRTILLALLIAPGSGSRGITYTTGFRWLPVVFGVFLAFAPCGWATTNPTEHDVMFTLHDHLASQLRGAPGVAAVYLAKCLASVLREKLRWRLNPPAGVAPLTRRQQKMAAAAEQSACGRLQSYIRLQVRLRARLALRGQLPKQRRHSLQDYDDTVWMRLYHDPRTADPNCYHGRKWFSRFRMPLELFNEIAGVLKQRGGWVNRLRRVVGGGYTAPVELQLMTTLRWLARGECPDTLSELTGETLSSTTVALTLKEVCAVLASLGNEWIRPPTSEEEIMYVFVQSCV